jgi:hypothetical protein
LESGYIDGGRLALGSRAVVEGSRIDFVDRCRNSSNATTSPGFEENYITMLYLVGVIAFGMGVGS